MIRAIALVACAASLPACKDRDKTREREAAESVRAPPPAAPANDPAPRRRGPDGQGVMETRCPTLVPGASVSITDVEGGVELLVTGADEEGAGEIRARADQLARKSRIIARRGGDAPPPDRARGRCPVVLVGTSLTVTHVDGGARITMIAAEGNSPDGLRDEVRSRAAALPGPRQAPRRRRARNRRMERRNPCR